MTSPPFGLVRKKSYGNEDADRYCDWFRPFAEGFKRVLKDTGSLVIDIGGAWIPGQPTRSLYHFKLLIMLCEEYGFHLCQEHYWWNPAKLPSPAEWVNVRRVRVKDAVNTCLLYTSDKAAQVSVTYARDHLFERSAVESERSIMTAALSRSMGEANFAQVRQEFDKRVQTGEFRAVEYGPKHKDQQYTTAAMLRMERETIGQMQEGNRLSLIHI